MASLIVEISTFPYFSTNEKKIEKCKQIFSIIETKSVIIYSKIESLKKIIFYQKYSFLPETIYFLQNLQNGLNPSCMIISSTIYISVDSKSNALSWWL